MRKNADDVHPPEDNLAVWGKSGYSLKKKNRKYEAFNQLSAMITFNLMILETVLMFQ